MCIYICIFYFSFCYSWCDVLQNFINLINVDVEFVKALSVTLTPCSHQYISFEKKYIIFLCLWPFAHTKTVQHTRFPTVVKMEIPLDG